MAKRSKRLKSIMIHLHGNDGKNEGFEVEHHFDQEGGTEYEPPVGMGVLGDHKSLMDHIHEHTHKFGAPVEGCLHCGDGEMEDEEGEEATGYEHDKKDPGSAGRRAASKSEHKSSEVANREVKGKAIARIHGARFGQQ